MQTKVSTKGQVVLPASVRRKLSLRAGDPLEVKTANGSIVLTPKRRRSKKATISIDPTTGLPVLDAGPDSPVLTSEHVRELLENFP